MMLITDLFSAEDMADAIRAGHIRTQQHPTMPYQILNYTEKCAYEGAWTPVTLNCRGLIIHHTTNEIIARPFPKFFNHGQSGCATINPGDPVSVTDKIDGSLGILYGTRDGFAIATRGSFTSKQAIHATRILHKRYPHFWPTTMNTYLFEIVYPENRIVVNYGDTDDIIGLGMLNIETGEISSPSDMRHGGWNGPVATTFECGTFADALGMAPRPNAEGIVVRSHTTGAMLKIKQEDYVRLHRIVTGLTGRRIWEHMVSGRPIDELIDPIPDEFHSWVRHVIDSINDEVRARYVAIINDYDDIIDGLPAGFTRSEFANRAKSHPDAWALFHTLDGRNIMAELLKRADPGTITPTATGMEDT